MKAKDVQVGKTYAVKVSGKIAPVRIDQESQFGGWNGTNVITGRMVRVKTAGKLRYEWGNIGSRKDYINKTYGTKKVDEQAITHQPPHINMYDMGPIGLNA